MVAFLLAGFETTSSALSYCIYEITKHHNEMLKLQAEVDAFFPPNSEVNNSVCFVSNRHNYQINFICVIKDRANFGQPSRVDLFGHVLQGGAKNAPNRQWVL